MEGLKCSHVVGQLVDEDDDDDHSWRGCVFLDFLKEEVHKGHHLLRPRMLRFLLHAVQNLLTAAGEVESVAAASLEVDDACFRLALSH